MLLWDDKAIKIKAELKHIVFVFALKYRKKFIVCLFFLLSQKFMVAFSKKGNGFEKVFFFLQESGT